MKLDDQLRLRPFIVDADDPDDALLWTRQIQASGGEVLGIEKLEDTYTVRALVPTQGSLNDRN